LLVIAIIVSKKLVSMGRKSCLFVYYAELINIELWMAEEATTLNDSLERRMVEGMIRRRIRNVGKFFFFHH
jgi:hypothetical protein